MDIGTGNRTAYRLLLVEDDFVISSEMKRHLEKWGYEVNCVQDFGNVLAEFAACSPHLVLMDIGLPFYNGYYWCSQIRQISQVPIIFVSSAGDNMNIVMAVNMGGDDFLTKPFEPEVLSAKVQAMLRRTYAFRDQTNHGVPGPDSGSDGRVPGGEGPKAGADQERIPNPAAPL